MSDPIALFDHEKLAFAGLVRALVRLDGQFTEAERHAIGEIGGSVLATRPKASSSYRVHAATEADEVTLREATEAMWDLLDRTASEFPDEAALRQAARGIERREAREAIYEALLTIAASDAVAEGELTLLQWLEEAWQIHVGADEGSV